MELLTPSLTSWLVILLIGALGFMATARALRHRVINKTLRYTIATLTALLLMAVLYFGFLLWVGSMMYDG